MCAVLKVANDANDGKFWKRLITAGPEWRPFLSQLMQLNDEASQCKTPSLPNYPSVYHSKYQAWNGDIKSCQCYDPHFKQDALVLFREKIIAPRSKCRQDFQSTFQAGNRKLCILYTLPSWEAPFQKYQAICSRHKQHNNGRSHQRTSTHMYIEGSRGEINKATSDHSCMAWQQ